MSEPWKTAQWFVSPWNFLPEVTSTYNFAEPIVVHDTTLRDGEQQAGVEFTKDDKVRIATALAEVGVHRIEAGMPAVSKSDEAAIKEIVKRNLGPQIFCLSRCMVDDVKRAVDCGVFGIQMELPSSEHIIRKGYKWEPERAAELVIKATTFAKEQGVYTVFFPVDASRAEMTWYLTLIERVAKEGHMDALGLVDTFGVLSPTAVTYFVRKTRERIPQPLEAHFHDDFGLAVANSLAALAAGADVVHTTVLGLGERAGNASLEQLAVAALTLHGVDLGIKYDKLFELSSLVRKLSGQAVPTNRSVAGDRLFNVESGMIVSWLKNCGDENLTEVFPFRPELVGHREAQAVLGKNSGLDTIAIWLGHSGLTASDEHMGEILLAVKAKSLEKKSLVTEEEFKEIFKAITTGDYSS